RAGRTEPRPGRLGPEHPRPAPEDGRAHRLRHHRRRPRLRTGRAAGPEGCVRNASLPDLVLKSFPGGILRGGQSGADCPQRSRVVDRGRFSMSRFLRNAAAAALAVAAVGVIASTANAQTYGRLVVFGDSLSDNGNLYAVTGG